MDARPPGPVGWTVEGQAGAGYEAVEGVWPVLKSFESVAEPGAGPARYVLSLTGAGRTELLKRLRKPADHEITDFTRFFTILAFLSHLPEVSEQHAVLRRRLEFLEEPASFFFDGDRPLRAEEVADPYRRGMLLTARAISSAERLATRCSGR
jgi:hypothetical protein